MYSILRNQKKSYGSQDVDNDVSIDIQRTTRQFTHNDSVGVLDANQQFIDERNACKDYRLILTINPFCSNELFNTCTEVVWKEGSDECQAVTNGSNLTLTGNPFNIPNKNINGKISGINRVDMVRNTEYSSEKIGFEYHPGYDIFNNHILRNKSYRIVNPLLKQSTWDERNNFNTISDYMRISNGNVLKKCNRLDINDTDFIPKHLYDREDILTFGDGESLGENLKEDNGWFGFYNTSVIPTKSINGDIMDINRVNNNKGNCEFVDMYPDRSLFSFIPKYNQYKNRLEDNWKIELTYAFESTVKDENGNDFTILQSGDVNALYVASVEYVINQTGIRVLMFRSFTKHNLKQNDTVFLYFSEDEEEGVNNVWHKSNKPYRVYSVGDINNNNTEYYFTIYDTELLNNIFATTRDVNYSDWDYVKDYFYTPVSDSSTIPSNEIVHYGSDGLTNVPSADDIYVEVSGTVYELCLHDANKTYRQAVLDNPNISSDEFIMQCINNAFTLNNSDTSQSSQPSDSPYTHNDVYLQFRFAKTNGSTDCKYYVRKFKKVPNMKNGHNGIEDLPFDNERYKLGFSETIYGDPIYQTVFTDNIRVDELKNNLGTTPKEIFATIVKTNVGHKEWYDLKQYTDTGEKRVEFSHCFGPVTCGFNFFELETDTQLIRNNRRDFCDVKCINNDTDTPVKTIGEKFDITVDDEWFYGDIVEFNPSKYTETVICDVNFRFNTYQRELVGDDDYSIVYDEIIGDDFDRDGFNVVEYNKSSVHKKEGYYYKPHYQIKLKGYSSTRQDAHYTLLVSNAEPMQNNGIFIKVKTVLRHNCAVNDDIILQDNVGGIEWRLKVVSVLSPYMIAVSKIDRDDPNYIDWFVMCDGINNGVYTLKQVNTSIPDYAVKISDNTFIWRDGANVWDIDNEDMDMKEYMFTNGALYIDECINFYLKRQDPDDINGLRINGNVYPYINDVHGERKIKDSIYAYKEDYQSIC